MENLSCKDCTHLRIKLLTEKNGKTYSYDDGSRLADSNILYPKIEDPHRVRCDLALIEGFEGDSYGFFVIRSLGEDRKTWRKSATVCAFFDGETDE